MRRYHAQVMEPAICRPPTDHSSLDSVIQHVSRDALDSWRGAPGGGSGGVDYGAGGAGGEVDSAERVVPPPLA